MHTEFPKKIVESDDFFEKEPIGYLPYVYPKFWDRIICTRNRICRIIIASDILRCPVGASVSADHGCGSGTDPVSGVPGIGCEDGGLWSITSVHVFFSST